MSATPGSSIAASYLIAACAALLVGAVGAVAWRESGLASLSVRSRALAAALAVLFAVVLLPSFRLNLENPAFGLTDTGGPPSEEAPSP